MYGTGHSGLSGGGMLYEAYQAQADFLAPARVFAELFRSAFARTYFGPAANSLFQGLSAGAELFSRAQLTHNRPDYRINFASMEGRTVPVRQDVALDAAFGRLLHFRKETNHDQPRVLIVAPM